MNDENRQKSIFVDEIAFENEKVLPKIDGEFFSINQLYFIQTFGRIPGFLTQKAVLIALIGT